jgi:1,2-beta-oligoglucan phosphorylase
MPFELRNDAGITITLRDNGAVEAIRAGGVLVNQVLGNDAEGGLGNVYLRFHGPGGIHSVPLLGPASSSRFGATSTEAGWAGSTAGIDYTCVLRLAPSQGSWFWNVRLVNVSTTAVTVDALLAQDLGLAAEAAVRASELYTSQYIDHTVIEDPAVGFLVCCRQNLPQDGAAPWVMHGCFGGTIGYLTDGVQFYGLDYKATNIPTALRNAVPPNKVYQYEMALPTLQSRPVLLEPGASAEVTFFAVFEPDHPAASSQADAARVATIAAAAADMFGGDPDVPWTTVTSGRFVRPRLFAAGDLTDADLERHFGTDRRHVEERDGTVLSFFHGDQRHVVLRAKELLSERPTGHIMLSGTELFPTDNRLAVTAWMFGVFASQLTIGNTSFHKVLSVVRNPLNVLKSSGQRIFLRHESGDEILLGVPSAFDIGPNDARWIYRDAERTLVVRVSTAPDVPLCRLEVDVERGGPVELLVTHHLVLGEHEGGPQGSIEIDPDRATVTMRPAEGTLLGGRYPAARFSVSASDPAVIRSIECVGEHLVVATLPVARLELAIAGSIVDEGVAQPVAERGDGDFWTGLANRLSLRGASGRMADDLARLDDTLRWYAHNAMVHYVSPHGLEQSGGAAWGVRDVCQGPVEYLITTGNAAPVRDIVRTVYEHQYVQTGDWPQWFMFDRYREIQQADSHGDVIHWPLKALCDYIEATNDVAFIDEPVPYTDQETTTVTAEGEPILAHVERQIERIEREAIPGTALPIYGGGDWEDTLQPADPALARNLVSTWTTELAYQTLRRFCEVCVRAGRDSMAERVEALAARMRADFNRYLVPDGVVAGLAYFGGDDVEYFLHPRDRKTGVEYRLLPMTRGMISGIFTPAQARTHLELIERHLLFPDGVRLMNRPMAYRGGASRFFKRAESAANFGREIGLQYVHAHIRYIEAMAKLGRAEAAFRGLLAICPIGTEHDVPSALPRQSNAYFSSSDAAFRDRHEAERDFHKLRTGEVGVKGGWRIYSSGPGIYTNQLVSNVLGLRRYFDDVVFDPVLPTSADGLTLDATFNGRPVRYRYRITGESRGVSAINVNGRPLGGRRDETNPYRPGGVLVPGAALLDALNPDRNEVEIVA